MSIRRLFWVGSFQSHADCAQNPWCSEAMNVTQLELLHALRELGVNELTAVSLVATSAWRSPQKLKRFKSTMIEPGVQMVELPFLALGPLQILTQALVLLLYLLTRPRRHRPDAILVTNPLSRYMLGSFLAAKLWHIPLVLFVADLTSPQAQARYAVQVRQWLQTFWTRLAPGAVVLSACVGEDLRKDRPWIRIVRPPANDLLQIVPMESAQPTIYFAGATFTYTGIGLLLEAIPLVRGENYRFWVSGRGPLDGEVQKAAQHDPRLTFWGFIPRDQYRDLLSQATVLVNPRLSTAPGNRYNFPSKLTEYMAVGKPIISTPTGDVGQQYGHVLMLLNEENPTHLAALIEEVCQMSSAEREQLGQQTQAAIRPETWQKQAQHLLAFMETLS
jgi:glycosyltransferase involved in cell wall biosynthesis